MRLQSPLQRGRHCSSTVLSAVALTATTLAASSVSAETVHVATATSSLVLDATPGKYLGTVYYGARLNDADLQAVAKLGGGYETYPAYGLNCPDQPALAVTHANGNMTTDLVVKSVERSSPKGGGELVRVKLQDRVYPFNVDVLFRTYSDAPVMETWTEVTHQEKGTVTLRRFDSGVVHLRRGEVWASHLVGNWGAEAQLVEEPLKPGILEVRNDDGVRNSHSAHAEMMFSLDGRGRENQGRVVGVALCYSGNYKLRIETGGGSYHHLYAGIDPDNSSYPLAKGETFATPALALTYSAEGLSGVSRNFHSWARLHKLANGTKLRKILLNSWEGVYMDVNQKGMADMMNDIASMGGELFVMDDGWFGDKYKRKRDNSSLGDWVVDREKLPEGIEGLLRDADKAGVKFGIWIEPEMANTTSELYEKHPEWALKAPDRDIVKGRGGTQVVLDMGRQDVQDFVFGIVDNLKTKYPSLDYIKWDANMSLMNHGSAALTGDRQSRLYIDYHRGFQKVMERIRAKYPDLTIQACASGGGRANYGVLPYFDEFWTSDNTDALQRIYMQWGTSYFFPACAMACHISAEQNHQTQRRIPLKFRIDVAMSGRLGMEIQPKNMTDAEKDLCRKAIEQYKQIRPVVQQGDIYRLLSPYDGQNLASLMYVAPDKQKAVFYWWKLQSFIDQHLPRVTMAGLDPQRSYKVTELNRIDRKPLNIEGQVFTGRFLMDNGLELPTGHNADNKLHYEWASRVLLLEAL